MDNKHEFNRICKGLCKKYRVTKPQKGGRYDAGQARCQICDIWIDYRGCHLKNNIPATPDSEGWYCSCCNYRVRMRPRNIEYKANFRMARETTRTNDESDSADLDYFNKRRAYMLKKLAQIIARSPKNSSKQTLEDSTRQSPKFTSSIEAEFDTNIGNLIDLACSESPNKISLIAEFEKIKAIIGHVPGYADIEKKSKFGIRFYVEEFKSLEYLLERLGYDPWQRNEVSNNFGRNDSLDDYMHDFPRKENDINKFSNEFNEIETEIEMALKDEPDILDVFSNLKNELEKCGKPSIYKIINDLKN